MAEWKPVGKNPLTATYDGKSAAGLKDGRCFPKTSAVILEKQPSLQTNGGITFTSVLS